MRHTNRETTHQTLTRLIKALDATNPATITYRKEETREAFVVDNAGVTVRRTIRTGRMIETIRTIEIYDITVSNAGDILIKAMDRETGESRTFRLDRLVSYTVHRITYVVDRPVDEEPTRPARGLATVTVLYPIDLDVTGRVQLLADTLAA
jgi:predicted DNA-binding transcriptional regulator YafY